jgi:hypothetical protein
MSQSWAEFRDIVGQEPSWLLESTFISIRHEPRYLGRIRIGTEVNRGDDIRVSEPQVNFILQDSHRLASRLDGREAPLKGNTVVCLAVDDAVGPVLVRLRGAC